MRVGINEVKGADLAGLMRHRIVMPVYIPRLDGYFEHLLEIFKLCLESLHLSVAGKASLTIVSNNSAPEVIAEIERCHRAGWIDKVVLNQSNRGKVDVVVSEARGAFEPLITISDCDVLFKTGWLEAIEALFRNFPECGFASPVPNPLNTWKHASATILGSIVRRELGFEKVIPDLDLDRFARSIDCPDLFQPEHRDRHMVVRRRGGAIACIGCNHFVFTTRKEVVEHYPKKPCLKAMGGGSPKLLDDPPDKLGYWRLATTRAYAYHMGNVPEQWMYDELAQYRTAAAGSSGGANSLSHQAAVSDAPLAARLPLTSSLPWSARKLLMRMVRRYTSTASRPMARPAARRRNGAAAGVITPNLPTNSEITTP